MEARNTVAGMSCSQRFYDFSPDLDMANQTVRAEVKKGMNFWLLAVLLTPANASH